MKFVIYGPHYDDNSGGSIALYKLCRVLTELGHDAKIWHWTRAHPFESRLINGKYTTYFNYGPTIKREDDPHFFTYKNATPEDAAEAIVVYPEIVEGNPLGAERVVRWLLNKPGALFGPATVAFGLNELTFYFDDPFLPDGWTADPMRKLRVIEWKWDVYKRTNYGRREGTCYMVRKGETLPLTYHPEGAIQVDGLSHRELAEIFNQCEQFISYDNYTAYSVYAALCGCDSIVVPREDVNAEEWHEAFPFGVAYGFDDLDRARRTMPNVVSMIADMEADNLKMVNNFVSICEEKFGA